MQCGYVLRASARAHSQQRWPQSHIWSCLTLSLINRINLTTCGFFIFSLSLYLWFSIEHSVKAWLHSHSNDVRSFRRRLQFNAGLWQFFIQNFIIVSMGEARGRRRTRIYCNRTHIKINQFTCKSFLSQNGLYRLKPKQQQQQKNSKCHDFSCVWFYGHQHIHFSIKICIQI